MEPDVMEAAFERAMKGSKPPDITPKEAEMFGKAFKDKEFRDMLASYVDEISDPKNRAEQEQYIAQLEGESKLPEGKELMRPKPGFVVKAFKRSQKDGAPGTKEKMFINICQSEKLLKPVATRTPEKGTSWTFPHALGPVRMEQDKSGSNAPTFDCCFHPDTLRMAQTNAQFRQLTVQVAIDSIIHAHDRMKQKITIDEGFKVLKGLDYKGAVVATMMMDRNTKEDAWKKGAAPPKANAPPQPAPSSARPVSSSTSAPAAPPSTTSSPSNAPKYSITERGHVDLGDYMMADPLGPKSTRPKELLIKIELPLVKNAGELELDVDERRLMLSAGSLYLLDIRLPYPVVDERSAAKFDKAKRVLNVTIPVQPPPVLPPRTATMQGIEDITVEGEGQEGESVDQGPKETGSGEGKKGGHDRWVAGEEEERLVLDQEEVARAVEKAKAEQAERAAREAERAEKEGTKPLAVEAVAVEEPQAKEVDWSWFNEAKEFNARRAFVGGRPGYVFKTGAQGVGYYRDEIASVSASSAKVGNGVVKGGLKPEFRFQQVEGSLTLIVSVPAIDPESVRADWGGASRKQVDISFEAVEGKGSSDAVRKGYHLHLDLLKEIEGTRCRFDVASKNMLIVLYKAKPELWLSLEGEEGRRQPEAPSGKENKGEGAAKTGALPSIGKQLGQGSKGTVQFRNKVALELD